MSDRNSRTSLLTQIDQRWLTIALAAAGATVADRANAAIVHHAPVGGITIPSDFFGVYVNLETGATGNSSGSVVGWDLNPYGATYLRLFNNGLSWVGTAAGYRNLAPGTMIDAASPLATTPRDDDPAFPLSINSSNNLIGFRFTDAAAVTHFGWVRFSLGATESAQPRSIVEWAYEGQTGVGITAGTIPAPGSLALLAAGAFLTGRRRKTA